MPRRDDDARSIRGRAVLPTAPALNDVLAWNGTQWAPAAPSGSGGSNSIAQSKNQTYQTVPEIFGIAPYALTNNPTTFRCVASAPNGYTMHVRVTDLTAGGTVKLDLTTASTSPTPLSGTFAPADATLRMYSVECYLSGGVPTSATLGACYGSYFEG